MNTTKGKKICSFCGRYSKKTKSKCSGCQKVDKWYKPKDWKNFDTTKKGKSDDSTNKRNKQAMYAERNAARAERNAARAERNAARENRNADRAQTDRLTQSISKTKSQRMGVRLTPKKKYYALKRISEQSIERLKEIESKMELKKKHQKTTPEFEESLSEVKLAIANEIARLEQFKNEYITKILSPPIAANPIPVPGEPVLTKGELVLTEEEQEQEEFDNLKGGRGRKTRRKRKRKRKRKTKRKRRRKTKRKNKRKTKRKRKTIKN
jgi:hypothetical protein